MINVDVNRGSENQFKHYYNRDWQKEPYQWTSKFLGKKDDFESYIKKPENLSDMIDLSERLVDSVPYLRVDWYILDNKLYFGELTFHHIGGTRPIEPKIWDKKLGAELSLENI